MSTVEKNLGTTAAKPAERPGLKLLIELGPLVVFVIVYFTYGIYAATATLMVGTVSSVVLSWALLGHVGMMPIVTAAVALVLGGLTFLLDDPSFIYRKPTIVNLLFAGALGGGLATGRYVLKNILGHAIDLQNEGWRKLTLRWMAFFVVLAGLNEVVWRTLSEPTWVKFKFFGILPLTLVFAAAQSGLIKHYSVKSNAE